MLANLAAVVMDDLELRATVGRIRRDASAFPCRLPSRTAEAGSDVAFSTARAPTSRRSARWPTFASTSSRISSRRSSGRPTAILQRHVVDRRGARDRADRSGEHRRRLHRDGARDRRDARGAHRRPPPRPRGRRRQPRLDGARPYLALLARAAARPGRQRRGRHRHRARHHGAVAPRKGGPRPRRTRRAERSPRLARHARGRRRARDQQPAHVRHPERRLRRGAPFAVLAGDARGSARREGSPSRGSRRSARRSPRPRRARAARAADRARPADLLARRGRGREDLLGHRLARARLVSRTWP